MSDFNEDDARRFAREYASGNFGFAKIVVKEVRETKPHGESRQKRYEVVMILSHSEDEIERLVHTGDPAQADIRREFAAADSVLTLVLSKDKVLSEDWKDMDFCW